MRHDSLGLLLQCLRPLKWIKKGLIGPNLTPSSIGNDVSIRLISYFDEPTPLKNGMNAELFIISKLVDGRVG